MCGLRIRIQEANIPEDGVRSLAAGVTGSFELPNLRDWHPVLALWKSSTCLKPPSHVSSTQRNIFNVIIMTPRL